jgi:sec-independent protein translocase protein TatA
MFTTLAIGTIGWPEILIIGIVALLIFGRRLPDVARNLGKGIVEFKKGLKGIEDSIDQTSDAPSKNIQSPPVSQATQADQESQKAKSDNETPDTPNTSA